MPTDFEIAGDILYAMYLDLKHYPSDSSVREITFDGDNDSCEIIFTLKSGSTWVITLKEDK